MISFYMKLEKNFFSKLEDIQNDSVDKIVDSRLNGDLQPDMQFQYHVATISNENLMDAIRHAMPNSKQGIFVDPCCGDGSSLILAKKAGYDVFGIDIQNALVNIAKENIDVAMSKSLIPINGIVNVKQGDMFNMNSYESVGVSFNRVDVFYLYSMPRHTNKFFKQFVDYAKHGAKIISVPGMDFASVDRLYNDLDVHGNLTTDYQDRENLTFLTFKKSLF
ncbi:MAG: DNA adenine methylase [archaeon]